MGFWGIFWERFPGDLRLVLSFPDSRLLFSPVPSDGDNGKTDKNALNNVHIDLSSIAFNRTIPGFASPYDMSSFVKKCPPLNSGEFQSAGIEWHL